MIKSKKADSLVWIIIWVFILSLILVWIINLVNYNKKISWKFNDNIYEYILNINWENLARKIDTSNISENENFYLYKNTENKEYIIYTWSTNSGYAYINKYWENINKDNYELEKFERIYTKQNDILKFKSAPNDLNNLVLHFDSHNINWLNNAGISNWAEISLWTDLSWNGNDWLQTNPTNRPIFFSNWLLNNPYIVFEWNKAFSIDNSATLNDDWDVWNVITWDEKSFAIIFKTWEDVNTFQNLYEQWDDHIWYAIQIENNNLFFGLWNDSWDAWTQYLYTDLWTLLPNTDYFLTFTQDSTNVNTAYNKIKIYLNWELASELNNIEAQDEHAWLIWLWATYHNSYRLYWDSPISTSNYINHFQWGWIWEFIVWNSCLSDEEIRWLNNYFKEKWINIDENVIYNTITTEIKKYNN